MADAGVILRDRGAGTVGARLSSSRPGIRSRRYRAPLVSTLQAAGDAGAAACAAFSINLLKAQPVSDVNGIPFVMPLMFIALCGAFGLYSAAGPSPYERFRLRAIGSACVVGLDMTRATGIGPPATVLIGASGAMLLIILGHYVEAALRAALMRAGLWAAPTVIVGSRDRGRAIAEVLLARPEIGLAPIGFATSDGDDEQAPDGVLPLPVVGTITDLGSLGAHVAVFTSSEDLARVIGEARAVPSFPRLLLVSDAKEIGSLWLHLRMLGDAIGIEIGGGRSGRRSHGLKRAIDLGVAIPLGLLAAPLIVALAGLVVLVSRGPAFYWQERVGRDGRPIHILKLRTMYVDAEQRLEAHFRNHPDALVEWNRFFKLKEDPRIVPFVGHFLRRSSLDELPQLWNVMRGDMSLVGPRPFPAYHLQAFDPEFRSLRVSVQPGLTGIWQISARSNGDLAVQKAQDLFYIRNSSLWLDFYILAQTPLAVVLGTGAR